MSSTFESHRDLRSTSKSYKRDKDTSSKWSMGLRPGNSCKVNFNGEQTAGTEGQFSKVRPQKKWSDMDTDRKDHSNISIKAGTRHGQGTWGMAGGRAARKTDALMQVQEGGMSKSLLELLPERAGDGVPGVIYSFDADSSPKGVLGLDKLIEGAEERYKNKETDKLVAKEYEILDEQGETVRRSKRSPGLRAQPKTVLLEDEDYELV